MSNHFQHFQRLHEWLRVASHQQCSNDIPGESFLAFGALTPNIMGVISWKLNFPFILYSCLRSPLPPPSPTRLAPLTQTSWSPLVGKVSAAILKIMAMIMDNRYLEALKNYKSVHNAWLIACPKIIFLKQRTVNKKNTIVIAGHKGSAASRGRIKRRNSGSPDLEAQVGCSLLFF